MSKLLAYNSEGQLLPATQVTLFLNNCSIKMITVDTNLDSGSSYSFPMPRKWRQCTECDITLHSDKVSILLGGDNYGYYPEKFDNDK